MENRKWLWIVIGVIGGGVCAIVCMVIFAVGGGAVLLANLPDVTSSSSLVGTTAPDFELYTLDGDSVTISQFRGSPVLLEFGATWCPDCIDTAPELQNLHETQANLVVLSVDSNESGSTVQTFVDKYHLTYTFALDSNGEVADLYQVWAIPTLFFIDSRGVIRDVMIETYSDTRITEALTSIGVQQ
jgi:peroxiredoxin